MQGAIHVALGIVKLPKKRHRREWIVIPQQCPASEAWTALPTATQLRIARYNLETLVMVSGGSIIPYSNQATEDYEIEKDMVMQLAGESGPLRFHEALMAAYAVEALEPWSLLPLAPESFTNAFEWVLKPCIASREETIGVLIHKLQTMWSANLRAREEGWLDINEKTMSLDRIGDLATEYFSGSSNYCAYYYDAMLVTFDAVNLPLEVVRRNLAALVAWLILHPNDKPYDEVNRVGTGSSMEAFLDSMISLLDTNPSNSGSREDVTWAVKIYGTYLWAWLHDHQHQDDNFVRRFHRRVFFE